MHAYSIIMRAEIASVLFHHNSIVVGIGTLATSVPMLLDHAHSTLLAGKECAQIS